MRKQILLITQGFPYGEAEYSFIVSEYEELKKIYDVIILALYNNKPLRYQVGNAHVIRYSYNKIFLIYCALKAIFDKSLYKELNNAWDSSNLKRSILRTKKIFSFDAYAIYSKRIIEKILQNNDVQMIYTYWCTPETLAGLKIKVNKTIKVITRAHGYDLYNERTKEDWQPFRYDISKESDAVILACKNAKNYFDKQWGGNTYLSYIGSKHRDFIKHETKNLVLVSCSNIIESKRVQLIVRALSIVPENIDIEWHHFGAGDQEDNIKQMAFELLQNKRNVKYCFHGYLKNEEILKNYETLKPSLFITTTQTEGGCPVSIQEIAAFGVPAIGTSVGGVPDIIIDNYTGFLLSENPSICEIKDKIVRYYQLNDSEKTIMKENMYSHWKENFDSYKCARKFVDIIDKIL